MAHLFSPLTLRELTLRNRIMMSPMCMYSAVDEGFATNWHLVHLGSRAVGGAGLIITETVAVEPRGRIHHKELGLWDDAQMVPLERIVRFCQAQGAAIGIQLAHAGRKAWTSEKGRGPDLPIGPSPTSHGPGWVEPVAMTHDDIETVIEAYRIAVQRAAKIGFDIVEIHAAHGYLLHQFLSPLSNHRTDEYGGSLDNRIRLHCQIVQAARQVWPANKPLFVRVSAADWVEDGLALENLVPVARAFKELGVDLIDCSSGGISPDPPPDLGPGYQVPFAEQIRHEAGVATAAVGLITSPELADSIVRNGRADLVAFGREFLRHPYWPLYAAQMLGHDVSWPIQYERARLSPIRRAANRPFVSKERQS